jgi:hypothetical protein
MSHCYCPLPLKCDVNILFRILIDLVKIELTSAKFKYGISYHFFYFYSVIKLLIKKIKLLKIIKKLIFNS